VRFVVVGAGGHSYELQDLVRSVGHEVVGFVDDHLDGPHSLLGLPVWSEMPDGGFDAVALAIGDNAARQARFLELESVHDLPTLAHPLSSVSPRADIGDGCQLMQYVTVSAGASTGVDCILNVGCFIAHSAAVGAHVHVAPGARVSGGCAIGDGALVGANAVLLPEVRVGEGCVVGAGAVVTRDVPSWTTCMGVPARNAERGGDARS
jgi:sugar O-acyltransferase (sialic acid O-acetyltransferase NeuD family)